MRVAVVAGVVVPHDAISTAAVEQVAALLSLPEVDEVLLFTQFQDREVGCPTRVIANPWQLLHDVDFRTCDIAIFHWGIHFDLFNAITLMGVPELPRPVVHFHNCTPPSLVDESQREHIYGSIHQLHHVIALGVRVWTYSEFNRRTLVDWGADEGQIDWVTFPIPVPRARATPRRDDDPVRLLVVGRLVPAKGPHVVVQALSMLPDAVMERVRLRIVGSTTFSSSDYRDELDAMVAASRPVVSDAVEIIISPSDGELAEIYHDTDVVVSPSFHEGLCVPIIEGYAAGCRAIGTTAGNLPFVVQPPDPVVPPGDPAALAAAIETMVDQLADVDEGYDARRQALVDSFSPRAASELLRAALEASRAAA